MAQEIRDISDGETHNLKAGERLRNNHSRFLSLSVMCFELQANDSRAIEYFVSKQGFY